MFAPYFDPAQYIAVATGVTSALMFLGACNGHEIFSLDLRNANQYGWIIETRSESPT
jgi:hypothetical protein